MSPTLSPSGKRLGRPKGSKNKRPPLPTVEDYLSTPARPIPILEGMKREPPTTPAHWFYFQKYAEEYFDTHYNPKVTGVKMRYIAPVMSSPANKWTFHGFVAMPPKPIPNKTSLPMFYLSLAHSDKRQIEGDAHQAGRVVTSRAVILVCTMYGALAVKWGFLPVGTEVVAKGKFGWRPSRFGGRTSVVLESLEVVGGESEEVEESVLSAEDRETLRVLMMEEL